MLAPQRSADKVTTSRIIKNAGYIGLVNIANYVVPLVTIPYLLRTIGAERYGALVFSQATIQYFVTFVEFGFGLSATRRIAAVRSDPERLRSEFSRLIHAKLILVAVAATLLVGVLSITAKLRAEWEIFLASSGVIAAAALMPTWFFQGIEDMRVVTLVQVIGRSLVILLLVAFVATPSDTWRAGLIMGCCPLAVAVFSFIYAMRARGMNLRLVSLKSAMEALTESFALFISSLSINLYTTTITFLLGILTSNSVVSAYSVAYKVSRACADAISPVSQAVYPRVVNLASSGMRAAAIRVAGRFGAVLVVLGTAMSVVLYIASPAIVRFLMGHAEPGIVVLMQLLAPLPGVVSLSTVFGVQLLLAFGITRLLVAWQAVTGLLGLPLTFWLIRRYEAAGAGWATVALETMIALGFFALAWILIIRNGNAYHVGTENTSRKRES